MKLLRCDVCVVGSGIAGISAALAAREAGACVVLVSLGTLGSGASFSGTTWGLGMVGPLSDSTEDKEAFVQGILAPAGDVATSGMAEVLANRFYESLTTFERWGAVLEPAEKGQETHRSYVPCFDTETRGWFGFHAGPSHDPLVSTVLRSGVECFSAAQALSLLKDPDTGALSGLVASCEGELMAVVCPCVVLATGGMAALRKPTLSSGQCRGVGASMAADAGAQVANLEFEQLMVGIKTSGTPAVFNEKLWRYTRLEKDGKDVFRLAGIDEQEAKAALEAHSWHGPYTSQRPSRKVEEAIWAVGGSCDAIIKRPEGELPSFIATYMDWLQEAHGLGFGDKLPVAVYHQASNGGIVIDPKTCQTQVEGLYAAGECAPLFAIDRLGGIASSQAMVFGQLAGIEGAAYAKRRPLAPEVLTDQLQLVSCPDEQAATPKDLKSLDAPQLKCKFEQWRAYHQAHGEALLKACIQRRIVSGKEPGPTLCP